MATAHEAVETQVAPPRPSQGVSVGSTDSTATGKKHRVTCTHHCARCERHFASLEAFDLHMVGRLGARVCTPPEEVEGDKPRLRLVEKATDAICSISGLREVHGVTVWQTEAAKLSGSRPA